MQRRAGVQQQAARLSGMVGRGELRGGVAGFLAAAKFAALTGRDEAGRLWSSPLVGPPGFLNAATPTQMSIAASPNVEDPLHALPGGQPVGLIVMDFAARRRLRINGTLTTTGERIVDRRRAGVRQLPPIHSSSAAAAGPAAPPPLLRRGDELVAEDVDQVQGADTFFLGTTPCRVRQRCLPPRGSSRLRACRRQRCVVARLPGQQHVQQPGQSGGRPHRGVAVRRLRQRPDPSAVRRRRGAMGRRRRA